MDLVLPILLSLVFPAILGLLFFKMMAKKPQRVETLEIDQAALDLAEKSLRESDEMDWVVLKRCHGPAYNHGVMTDLVASLNAEGVDATYDVVSSSSAEGGGGFVVRRGHGGYFRGTR